MGGDSKKDKSNQHPYVYYDIPRRYWDEKESSGNSEFPRYLAEDMISHAPFPSHNKSYGRRPHAHRDDEHEFEAEKAGKKTLDGDYYVPGSKKPVLWSYPATYFDYENQNRFGQPQQNREGASQGLEPGPHRIITDRDKNIQGMVSHPVGNKRDFERAPARIDWIDDRSERGKARSTHRSTRK